MRDLFTLSRQFFGAPFTLLLALDYNILFRVFKERYE